uniref:Uncharacterized protein n=2 Tax=Araneus ventricosus TaxID=182803 RepID=A0A4Y2WFX6_ARAVE|nr:hypothetical protein AVEN_190954-1 [Araneus ventricosus]
MANGEDISSTQDSDKTTILKIGESSEAQMTNGTAEESLNNIDNISPNSIEEIESMKSVKDEGEIGNGQAMTSSSEPDEHTKDITESLPSAQEMSNTSSTSTKVVNDVETMNKNNAETSTLVKTAVSSPSEKLTVSTSRQKVTAAGDVCVAPVTIDISFIYACH